MCEECLTPTVLSVDARDTLRAESRTELASVVRSNMCVICGSSGRGLAGAEGDGEKELPAVRRSTDVRRPTDCSVSVDGFERSSCAVRRLSKVR